MALAIAGAALTANASSAEAAAPGARLDAVRAAGVVRCGAVARPGLAQRDGAGRWAGILVDICRAVATAALGAPARIAFHDYASDADFDRVRSGRDDVYFLTGGEINAHGLAGRVLPGPAVFGARIAVMVPADAPERHLAQLAGAGVCYRIAATAERGLEAHFGEHAQPWLRHAFSEDGEMMDAYAAQRCHAVAGEATWLAGWRAAHAPGQRPGRLLPEAVEAFPIIAATGTGDGHWSAIVAWTINTLRVAERPETTWFAGGARAMPVAAPELGLAAGWQEAVIAATGNYGAIYARHLGPGTATPLERDADAGPPLPFAE